MSYRLARKSRGNLPKEDSAVERCLACEADSGRHPWTRVSSRWALACYSVDVDHKTMTDVGVYVATLPWET